MPEHVDIALVALRLLLKEMDFAADGDGPENRYCYSLCLNTTEEGCLQWARELLAPLTATDALTTTEA